MTASQGTPTAAEPPSTIFGQYVWILLVPIMVLLVLGAAWPLAKTLLFSFTEASADHIDQQWFVFLQYLEYAATGLHRLLAGLF